jgi:excisionase family DNA binding protein
MDLYIEIGEIKREQEKILSLLNDLKSGNSKPSIYDLVDLQEILKVSKRTIASWLQQGILPHTKVGAKIWVTEDQLNSFLEQHSSVITKITHLKKIGGRSNG